MPQKADRAYFSRLEGEWPAQMSRKTKLKAKLHTFPLAVSANQRWIPQFQEFLRALTVHIRRMIVLLTN